jgi:signal transduction histidine kinase
MKLATRIASGYAIMITVAAAATAYCIVTLQLNKKMDEQLQDSDLPVYLMLKDLDAVSRDAAKLTNHWIYQPNMLEKAALANLHDKEYPKLRKRLKAVLHQSKNTHADSVQLALSLFDAIVEAQRRVRTTLNLDSRYADDKVVDDAISIWNNAVCPACATFDLFLSQLLNRQKNQIDRLQFDKELADTVLSELLLVMIAVFAIASVGAWIHARSSVAAPIVQAKDLIISLGRGKLVDVKSSPRHDEIGEMMRAMRDFTTGMNAKLQFAEHIGNGNYNDSFQPLGSDDVMGKALINMRDQLKKRNADLDRLVYSASHDLRSPIASVKGLSGLIRLDGAANNVNQCLDLIDQSMDRLDGVIHEIVDFFRNARADVREEWFDLELLIHNTIASFSAEEDFARIHFDVQVQKDHRMIRSDRARFAIIVKNLISNAIHFHTRKGMALVMIHVSVDTHIALSVEDNGIGIPKEFHGRVFDMFFRGHESRSGSGLGLYVLKEVVSSLSGTVTLHSELGQGTHFNVRIPLKSTTP